MVFREDQPVRGVGRGVRTEPVLSCRKRECANELHAAVRNGGHLAWRLLPRHDENRFFLQGTQCSFSMRNSRAGLHIWQARQHPAPQEREILQRVNKRDRGNRVGACRLECLFNQQQPRSFTRWHVRGGRLDHGQFLKPNRMRCLCRSLPASKKPLIAPGQELYRCANAVDFHRGAVKPSPVVMALQMPHVDRHALCCRDLGSSQAKVRFQQRQKAEPPNNRCVEGTLRRRGLSGIKIQTEGDMHGA